MQIYEDTSNAYLLLSDKTKCKLRVPDRAISSSECPGEQPPNDGHKTHMDSQDGSLQVLPWTENHAQEIPNLLKLLNFNENIFKW